MLPITSKSDGLASGKFITSFCGHLTYKNIMK